MTAPQAIIQPANGTLGRFSLQSLVSFMMPGYIHIWTRTCVAPGICWTNRLCDGDVSISGVARVQSVVDVVNVSGTAVNTSGTASLVLQPATNVKFLEGPKVRRTASYRS